MLTTFAYPSGEPAAGVLNSDHPAEASQSGARRIPVRNIAQTSPGLAVTLVPMDCPMTVLHDILDWQAQRSPDRPAIRSRSELWTYRELRRRSLAYAEWLNHQGVRRGDRVLVIAPHAPQTAALVFAASRLGAIYVVATDRMPGQRLRDVARDCAPRVLLSADSAPPGAAGVPHARLADLPAHPSTGPAAEAAACLSIDPVSLIYTSGSTAAPKAVVSTHQQVLFAARAIQSRLGYRADDVIFNCLPLSFDYGLYQLFLACLAGAELVLAGPDDAGPALLTRLRETEATVFPLMPSLAAVLTALLRRPGPPLPRLRMVTSSGAAMPSGTPDELRHAVPGLAVVLMFGLTECKRVAIMEPNGDIARPGAVGLPLPDTEVSIIRADGSRAEPGEVGELAVRGGHVMSGYWRAPELTARKFSRDEFGQPLLRTGDLCWLDRDGYLYFADRNDGIYKQRGFRVSAAEVEAAALDLPGVLQAAVIPRDDSKGAVLFIGGEASAPQVLAGVASRLEDFKVPAECRVASALPLGSTGKVDKRVLTAMLDEVDGRDEAR